jgi:hypothetical protein
MIPRILSGINQENDDPYVVSAFHPVRDSLRLHAVGPRMCGLELFPDQKDFQ